MGISILTSLADRTAQENLKMPSKSDASFSDRLPSGDDIYCPSKDISGLAIGDAFSLLDIPMNRLRTLTSTEADIILLNNILHEKIEQILNMNFYGLDSYYAPTQPSYITKNTDLRGTLNNHVTDFKVINILILVRKISSMNYNFNFPIGLMFF